MSSSYNCLLCCETNGNLINFYSERGKELNVISILSTHFWFQLDEIKVLSQNICNECWKNTESFHEFYQSIRLAHKKFETVFVKIENELDIEDYGEIYQSDKLPDDNFVTESVKIENNQDDEDDESSNSSVYEIPHTNSIDVETRAFDELKTKTQHGYLKTYDRLMTWKTNQNIDKKCFSEAVMLEYFYHLKPRFKPASLWSEYSKLRTTIQRNDNVDISYPEVTSLLKKNAADYYPKKRKAFRPDEVRRFFSEAKDIDFLVVKVIMIFMIYGLNRSKEFSNVKVGNVTEQGSVFVVKFHHTKTNTNRSFTVDDEYAACIKKYKSLRPTNISHDRFFLHYLKGRCTLQTIGKKTFLNTPKVIANFLKLEDAESYTCCSFRKQSTKENRGKTSELNSEQVHIERRISKEDTAMSVNASPTVENTSTIQTKAKKNCEEDKTISLDSLPKKSQKKYLRTFDKFMNWKTVENIDEGCFSEEVMLDYFNYIKTKYKPNSLWWTYSTLRAVIENKYNIDISYPELRQFLKASSFGYLPRKTSTFLPQEIQRFLCEAEDEEYLAIKVIMIFAIFGTTRVDALFKIDVTDVSEQGSVVVVKISEGTDFIRSFTLENEYTTCVKKYIKLRPDNLTHTYFFISYQKGKCSKISMGRNQFLNAPKVIAKYLNLKDIDSYSCQSFRTLKRKGGTCSSVVSDAYIEECRPKKRNIGDSNSGEINFETSTEEVGSSLDTLTVTITSTARNLLPEKSREKYVRSYENFMLWKTNAKLDRYCFSEAVMLEYFNHQKTKYKPPSLWAEYSKLRATIKKNDDVDINYPALTALLKNSSAGYQPPKWNVFQPQEILKFLSEAEDIKFLVVKIILIFGFHGKASADELIKIEVEDVTQHGLAFCVKIVDRKTNVNRSFNVENEYATYVRKYINLRLENTNHRRFFVNYQNGKCSIQPTGQTVFRNAPKVIAKFLNLKDPDNYSCYRYRLRSINNKFLAGSESDVLSKKRRGRGSSSSTVDSYVENSIANNRKTGDIILQQNNVERQTEPCTTTNSMDLSTIPIAFQSFHAQPHPVVQPYQLLPYGTVNVGDNNHYVQQSITESVLGGIQFNNFHDI